MKLPPYYSIFLQLDTAKRRCEAINGPSIALKTWHTEKESFPPKTPARLAVGFGHT